jgi:hypothetical protein
MLGVFCSFITLVAFAVISSAQAKVLICLMYLLNKLTLSNTEAEVGINNDFTEQIVRNSDVRQGDSLMATLFCLVM